MKVIIVGGGQVGSYIASLLLSNGNEVRIIEHRENVFNKLQMELPPETLIFGNGSDPDILEQAGIENANVVAAVTGADEINLVVSTLAKMEFGVSRVVARVNNPKNVWLYNKSMGVDVGVNQADLMAHLIVEEMNINDMFTLLRLNHDEYSIVQMKVASKAKAVGCKLKDLSIPKTTVLIAITRNDSIMIPKGETSILSGDDILALTSEVDRKKLGELFG
ncbi:MAG: TrkA family potassium uptake protein [Bacillota bacterium]|nr:TrkA family potassium uptake protein [Bacillota bacterium]